MSQKEEWLPWVRFFLEAIGVQSRDAIRRSDAVLVLWTKYRSKLQEARASALLLSLVDELFSLPAINTKIASRVLEVTPRSAQLNIDKLDDSGILKEVTGQRRNRIYAAHEIISTIEKVDL